MGRTISTGFALRAASFDRSEGRKDSKARADSPYNKGMRMRPWFPLVVGLGAAPFIAAFFTAPTPKTTSSSPAAETNALLGLWQATQPEKEGDRVRFYYFHTGGIGLVRYGRMGLTYTRSFHWKASGDDLTLVFTKTGKHHRVAFKLEADRTVLHLPEDPAFPGNHRYQRDQRPRGLDFSTAAHPLARLWVQPTHDRRGGQGFRMYQLQAPTIDGRGVGWYHEGDMAEWSTETLSYRRTGDKLELYFPIRNERVTTSIRLEGKGKSKTLTLMEDPRNYWHERTYTDGGPGFTAVLEGLPLPYSVPGYAPGQTIKPRGTGSTCAGVR